MQELLGGTIAFIVGDYYVTFAVIGIVIGVIINGVRHRWASGHGWRTILDWWTLFAVGIANLVNFVFHAFLGDFSAEEIGWEQSPFQMELALASLGIGVAGIVAFPRRVGWTGKLIGNLPAWLFVLGAGIVHVYEIATSGNMAFGNAGPILWSDFYLPVTAGVLLVLAGFEVRRVPPGQHKVGRTSPLPRGAS